MQNFMQYNQRIIEFFKKYNLYQKELFDYLQHHTWGVCYVDPDEARLINTYFFNNKFNNKLTGFLMVIPDQTSDITMFVQVHEIAHGIMGYKYLGKKYPDDLHEVLPFMVEKLYVNEVNDDRVSDYSKYLDSKIDEDTILKYRFALAARDELLDGFDGNLDKIDKQSKLLLRKYKKEHK